MCEHHLYLRLKGCYCSIFCAHSHSSAEIVALLRTISNLPMIQSQQVKNSIQSKGPVGGGHLFMEASFSYLCQALPQKFHTTLPTHYLMQLDVQYLLDLHTIASMSELLQLGLIAFCRECQNPLVIPAKGIDDCSTCD